MVLQRSLHDELSHILLGKATAKEMWDAIIGNFETSVETDGDRLVNVMMELINLLLNWRLNQNHDVLSKIRELTLILAKLKAVDTQCTVNHELAYLYAGLPEKYQSLLKLLRRTPDMT